MDTTSLIMVASLNALGIIGSGLFPMWLSRRAAIKDQLHKTRTTIEGLLMTDYPQLLQTYNSYKDVVQDYGVALEAEDTLAANDHLERMRAYEDRFDECYQLVASRLSELGINVRRTASVDDKMSAMRYVRSQSAKIRHVKKLIRHPIPDKAYEYFRPMIT